MSARARARSESSGEATPAVSSRPGYHASAKKSGPDLRSRLGHRRLCCERTSTARRAASMSRREFRGPRSWCFGRSGRGRPPAGCRGPGRKPGFDTPGPARGHRPMADARSHDLYLAEHRLWFRIGGDGTQILVAARFHERGQAMSPYWTDDDTPQLGWTDWRPAHAPTCRKGWCSAPAAEGSDWCAKHLEAVTAQRAAIGATVLGLGDLGIRPAP
jgi:hypothetical protein